MGCFRAPGVYNFSILWSLFVLSFLTYLEQWRGFSQSKQETGGEIAFPVSQPRLILAQVYNAATTYWSPCTPIPDLYKSSRKPFKKEGVLLHVISLHHPCWAGMAKWAQLSVSWDAWLPIISWYQTSTSFSLGGTQKYALISLTICKYPIYFPFLHFMWILIITIFSLKCLCRIKSPGQGEKKRKKEGGGRDPHELGGEKC